MRLLLLAVLITALAGCHRDRPDLKPDLPDAGTAVAPQVVEVVRTVYVRIPPYLTQPEPIAEGPIPQCYDVARARRAAIERGNAKLGEIAAIEGTEVTP